MDGTKTQGHELADRLVRDACRFDIARRKRGAHVGGEAVKPYGKETDPSRHVLAEDPRAEAGMVNVSLAALAYVGASGELAEGSRRLDQRDREVKYTR